MKRVCLILAGLLLAGACTRADEEDAEAVGATEAAPAAAPAAAAPVAVVGVDGPDGIPAPLAEISLDAALVAKGKEIFGTKGCAACHKLGGGKLVGPDLKGVTERRSSKWVQRMILRPDLMLQQDPVAKDLFKAHLTPMPNQGIDANTELPALMAFLKANEK